MDFRFQAIGSFHCAERYPYDAARQGSLAAANPGVIRLLPACGYEQALRDIEGFSHLWVLYVFHHNRLWRPLIQPPRSRRRVGVFASRAPYRPNPIGLSCVELVGVRGLELSVRGHDLLDGTPVLDLKPYLAYADSVPAARTGWLAQEPPAAEFTVEFSPGAAARLAWLAARGVDCLEGFLRRQLGHEPLNRRRKRLSHQPSGDWEIFYRTWRAAFQADIGGLIVCVTAVRSGYSAAELAAAEDPYADKQLHREFADAFPDCNIVRDAGDRAAT